MSSKTILITGSTRGIGLELANHYAKENYNVVMNYNGHMVEVLCLSN